MSLLDEAPIHSLFRDIKKSISTPSKRTKQAKIGPSNLGSRCAWCLANTMAYKIHGRTKNVGKFSLRPWLGTCVHFWLEHHIELPYETFREEKVTVGVIKGDGGNPDYGEIRGTLDLYSEQHAALIDYKTSTKAVIKKYARDAAEAQEAHRVPSGLLADYAYQSDLYGLGLELKGLPITHVGLLMIPTDSANVSDVTLISRPYSRENALKAIRRGEKIWNDYVLTGKQEELEQAPDCFGCGFLGSNGVEIALPNEGVTF